MKFKALPCMVCGKKLDQVEGDDMHRQYNQPYRALTFTTPGAYGTTVFDPMDGSLLEINICDEHVRAAMDKGWANEYHPEALAWSDKLK